MKVFVTGASGFAGQAITKTLSRKSEFQITAGVRLASRRRPLEEKSFETETFDLGRPSEFARILTGKNVVIHAAAKAHASASTDAEIREFHAINVDATLELARQAAAAGVRRFIFLSSIGVNGNENERPFTAFDRPNPQEVYAQSKWLAEQGLLEINTATGMEIVRIRPPLVYGPDAPGNFGRMVAWVDRGVPLPFGAIKNLRSFVALPNLVDLVATCVTNASAANELFLVADGEDLSTTEMLRRLGSALMRPAVLLPVPVSLLQTVAVLAGKRDMARRLFASLTVDIMHTRKKLGWAPPLSVDEGLALVAKKSTNSV